MKEYLRQLDGKEKERQYFWRFYFHRGEKKTETETSVCVVYIVEKKE